jgi:hypothetical protein
MGPILSKYPRPCYIIHPDKRLKSLDRKKKKKFRWPCPASATKLFFSIYFLKIISPLHFKRRQRIKNKIKRGPCLCRHPPSFFFFNFFISCLMCSRRAAGLLLHQPGKVNVSLSLCVSRTLSLNSPSPCPLCLFVVLLFHAVMCVCAPHCCGPTVIFYRPSCAQKRRRRKRTRAVLTTKVLLPTTTTTTTTNPYVPT